VRRTSDNSQKDIGFLETDLDVPTLLRFCNGFDGFVSIWYDQSGEENHVYQPEWTLQPQLVENGKVIVDLASKRATLRFQGATMESTWNPQSTDMQTAGISAVASTGIVTLNDTGNVITTGRQTGAISTYDLGAETIRPKYPDFKLPEGYDTFALESFTYQGNLLYAHADTPQKYHVIDVNRGQDPPTVTDTATTLDVVKGPSVITASKVLPRFADSELVYPVSANDEFSVGLNGTNGNVYCIPYNARYIVELDEDGGVDDAGEVVASATAMTYDLGTIAGKYYTGVEHTDGVYGIPYNASKLLYINTTVSPATVHEISSPLFTGSVKFGSAQKVGSAVYCIPYNTTNVIKITLNGTLSVVEAIGSAMSGPNKFWGSAVAGQYIISPPERAGSILVIDSATDTVSLVGSTGGYFEVNNRGRGYPLTGKTVTAAAQNDGDPAQGFAPVVASRILTAVVVSPTSATRNYGYYETPAVRVTTGTHTYRDPRVRMIMTDDGTGTGGKSVDSFTITDGGDNVEGCSIQLIGGFGKNAKARAYVNIDPNTGYGPVAYVDITNAGSGYINKDDIKITVSGGRRSNGTNAVLSVDEIRPLSEGGGIALISVVSGGSGYLRPPTVTISGGKGKGASVSPKLTVDGKVADISFTGGSGYSFANGATDELAENGWTETQFFDAYVTYMTTGVNTFANPNGPRIKIQHPNDVTFTDANGIEHKGNPVGSSGGISGIERYAGACAYIKATSGGVITEIGVISTGSGYIGTPTITVEGNATMTATFEKDGVFSFFPSLVNPGTKYTQNVAAAITGTRSELNPTLISDAAVPGPQGSMSWILEGEAPRVGELGEGENQYPGYVYQSNRVIRRHGESKFRACCYDPGNSVVYALPWGTHRILSIETSVANLGRPSQILGNLGTGGEKVSDAIFFNGIAYAIPYNWRYVMTVSNNIADWIRSPNGRAKRFNGQWNRGILNQPSGTIYGVPANENALLIIDAKLDPNTGDPLNSLSTTEYFGNLRGRGDKFWSAVLSTNGIIYFVNKDSTFMVELNPGTSALRKTALPDIVVFPQDDVTPPVIPKQVAPEEGITFADGVELPNGNVIFIPTYNVSDSFAYNGKIMEVDPATSAYTLHDSVPVANTAPFPSRCLTLQGTENNPTITWIPRSHPENHAIMTWNATAGLKSIGERPENQSEVRWATQTRVTSDTTCGCVPSQTTITQDTDFDQSYFNNGSVWKFCDPVVDQYQRIFLIPGTVTKTSSIDIMYPTDPQKTVNTSFNLANPVFPLNGVLGNTQLTYPTTITIDSGLWSGWGPPLTRSEGDEIAIAYGGATFSGADQRIYCVPFNCPEGLIVDPVFHNYEPLGAFEGYSDTPVLRTTVDREGNVTKHAQQMYRGLVEGGNSKLYGIPYGANNVCEIDPSIEDASVRSDFLPTTMSSILPATSIGFYYEVYEGYFETYGPLFFTTTGDILRSGIVTDMSSLTTSMGGALSYAFSVQWTGIFKAPVTGTYTFATSSDDASYLWVYQDDAYELDFDTAVVKNGGKHGVTTQTGTINLVAGQFYTVVIQYGEAGAGEAFSATVTQPGGSATSDWSTYLQSPPGGINYNAKWWGGVRARNNKIYCAPFDADAVLVISPGEGIVQTTVACPPNLQGLGRGGNKWVNGVLAENGNIYFCPCNSPYILKIIPGENGDADQMALIPFFGGTAKVWSGVYSSYDKFIYFFPGFQNSTLIRFDTVTESYDRLGDSWGSSDYRYPGRWISRPALLPSGEAYVFHGRGVSRPLKLEPGQTQLFETKFSSAEYLLGQPIQQDYTLRPFTVEYQQQEYILFHNAGTYGLYDPNADTLVKAKVPLIQGPSLPRGVTGLLSKTSFASLYKATLNIVDLFQGGVGGVRSPTNTADLSLLVAEPSLISSVANTEAEIRNIFRTVFREGNMGVFASLSSSDAILHYIRESAILQTTGYTPSGTVDAPFTVGLVTGFPDRQLTCPNTTRVLATTSSSGTNSNAFDTDVSSAWQSSATYDPSNGNANTEQWIAIDFDGPVRIGSFALTSASSNPATMPSKVTLQAKDASGDPWVDVQVFAGIEKTEYLQYERKTFTLTTCGYHSFYRLVINSVFPEGSAAELAEWVLFGRFSPGTGAFTSQFSGHISEIVALSNTDQQKAGYGEDQVFYFNFSSSPYITSGNSTNE